MMLLDSHSNEEGRKDRKNKRLYKCDQQLDQSNKDDEKNRSRRDGDGIKDKDQTHQG